MTTIIVIPSSALLVSLNVILIMRRSCLSLLLRKIFAILTDI